MEQKDEALKPVFNIPGFIEKPREKDIEELTEDEKTLGQGADQAFWLTLKKHIENELVQLDQINEHAIAQGLPAQEIGQNAIVISQVKGVISKIFYVVDDAKEATEQMNLQKEALGRGEKK